jgi:hypothetical protein
MKKGFYSFLILLLLGQAASAKKPVTYQTGRFIRIHNEIIALGALLPIRLFTTLTIRGNDSTYVVSSEKSADQFGWGIGDPVDFRVRGNKVYLKLQSGKELKTKLLRVYGAMEAIPPPVIYSPPLQRTVTSSGKVAKTVSLGEEFLRRRQCLLCRVCVC